MKKFLFPSMPRLARNSITPIYSIGILLLLLFAGGCGKKIYTPPPDKGVTTHLILINEIYSSGFYVEVDGNDAGFLQQELDIRVKPGEHKLKVFNKETSLSLLKEKQVTISHQFDLTVKVGEGEAKKIVLSWEDEGYSKKTRKGLDMEQKEKEKEEADKKRRRENPIQGSGY